MIITAGSNEMNKMLWEIKSASKYQIVPAKIKYDSAKNQNQMPVVIETVENFFTNKNDGQRYLMN